MIRSDRHHVPRWLTALVVVLPLLAYGVKTMAAAQAKAQNPHGSFKEDCSMCHSPSTWKISKVASRFDHSRFGFPLSGAHATSNCMTCHKSLDFAQSKTQCISCHQDPHRGEMGTECARCHSARSFTDRGPMVRAHQLTKFPLTGSHATIECEGCHKPSGQGHMQFVGTQADCKSCHMAQYNSTKEPDHAAGGFPTDCQGCHTPTSWSGAKFNHNATRFPLTGAHATTACVSCHGSGGFKALAMDCYSCHASNYSAAQPAHTPSGFPTSACSTCHNTTQWAGAVFNHSSTPFPLTGSHGSVACAGCHGDGVYKGKTHDCYTCHTATYTSALPKHDTAAFPTAQCGSCHNTTAWNPGVVNHNAFPFKLTGAHAGVACTSCHGDGVYAAKSQACYDCHTANYNAATPTHSAASFPPTQCATCHSTTAFMPATFNHSATAFPLTGAHVSAACTGCHGDGVYKGKTHDCYTCHTTTYNAATPAHTPTSFPPTACATCHNTTQWAGASFNHATTAFPLTGAHQATACTDCHGDGVYKGKTHDCYTCHTATYTSAVPRHDSAAFPTAQCGSCHTTTAWNPGVVNHNAFPFKLTGAHVAATCVQCHGDGVYAAKSQVCYDCHTANYAAATPTHTATSFPASQCATCHSTTAFTPATFNHATTAFPLTGAHLSVACSGCHGDGVYKGKTTACSGCHMTDYNTASPNHAAAGFAASACATCHTTTAWTGAQFTTHDAAYFPIYSGKHNGKWSNDCSQCHANSANFAVYSCAQACHTSQLRNHKQVNGFNLSTVEIQCYVCHRTGSAG
jgi:hypothetical protein